MGPAVTFPKEGCFDIHIYPGIPSAAIDSLVNKRDDDLSELVPSTMKEMLASGEAQWVKCDRAIEADRYFRNIEVKFKHEKSSDDSIRYIELFAGIGGFRCALDSLGAECVMASEFNRECRETYKANFGEDEPLLGDINWIDAKIIPEFEILTAGFPC